MKEFEQLIQEIEKDKEICSFLRKNALPKDTIIESIGVLLQQKENNRLCKKCMGKIDCLMDVEGMQSHLTWVHNEITMVYRNCPYYKDGLRTLEYLYFPNQMETDGTTIASTSRASMFQEIARFQQEYKKGAFVKGIYVSGPFGVGKSYLLLALAKWLARRGIPVMYVYYPDWIRHLKSAIGNNSLEYELNRAKNVEILMLDDVGSEASSAFVRDEILGSLLQYRIFGNLPMFMTSNLSIDELHNHFMDTKTDGNKAHSGRITDRIRHLMNIVELKDANYRDAKQKKKALDSMENA